LKVVLSDAIGAWKKSLRRKEDENRGARNDETDPFR
jgi:hypothetical protein